MVIRWLGRGCGICRECLPCAALFPGAVGARRDAQNQRLERIHCRFGVVLNASVSSCSGADGGENPILAVPAAGLESSSLGEIVLPLGKLLFFWGNRYSFREIVIPLGKLVFLWESCYSFGKLLFLWESCYSFGESCYSFRKATHLNPSKKSKVPLSFLEEFQELLALPELSPLPHISSNFFWLELKIQV